MSRRARENVESRTERGAARTGVSGVSGVWMVLVGWMVWMEPRSRRWRPRSWWPALAAIGVSMVGCALPLPRIHTDRARELLVGGYAAENPAGGISRRIVMGVDLRRDARRDGLTVGISMDTRCVTEHGPAPPPEGLRFDWPLVVSWRNAEGTGHRVGVFVHQHLPQGGDAPEFAHAVRAGASLDVAPGRGLSLGFSSRTVLTAPLETPRLYRLRYRSRADLRRRPCLKTF